MGAPATHQTNNDFDIILGDRCQVTTQRSGHFLTSVAFSNIMMASDRPKMSQTCSICTRLRLLAGHERVTMFWFISKSLDKDSTVLA